MLLSSPEERIKLLKAGWFGYEIEQMYIKQNSTATVKDLNICIMLIDT